MGEKDITEKQLFELNDVFADIVNVLLLDGKEMILPKDLKPAKKDSVYKDKELKTRMQERDVAKFWEQGNVRLAFFGLENQTDIDPAMPFRIASYDGAVYKEMLRDMALFPAITLVLHFDYEKRWKAPRSLKECFANMPSALVPYISDYKINVFEIAWLDDATILKFKSDFRFVADYYSQMRKTGKWKPMPDKVKHLKEIFDLFAALTKDMRFVDMFYQKKGDADNMSSVALDYWEKIYTDKGKDMATLDYIRNLMKTAKISVHQAMDALLVPKEDRQKYMDRI